VGCGGGGGVRVEAGGGGGAGGGKDTRRRLVALCGLQQEKNWVKAPDRQTGCLARATIEQGEGKAYSGFGPLSQADVACDSDAITRLWTCSWSRHVRLRHGEKKGICGKLRSKRPRRRVDLRQDLSFLIRRRRENGYTSRAQKGVEAVDHKKLDGSEDKPQFSRFKSICRGSLSLFL